MGGFTFYIITTMSCMWCFMNFTQRYIWISTLTYHPSNGNTRNPSAFGKDKQYVFVSILCVCVWEGGGFSVGPMDDAVMTMLL